MEKPTIAAQFTTHEGGNGAGAPGWSKGRREGNFNRSKNREPDQCPPDWIRALAENWARLEELELSSRIGSGDYELHKRLFVPEAIELEKETITKAQLKGKPLFDAAEALGQDIWDECYSVTNSRGPVMDWQLSGFGIGPGKKKPRVELFSIGRRCRADGTQGTGIEDYLLNAGTFGTVDTMLRTATTQSRDLHQYNVKLLAAVTGPIESVGALYRNAVDNFEDLRELEKHLMSEVYRGELIKAQQEVSKQRWIRIEGMWTTTVETIGADLLGLGSMLIEGITGGSEFGPLPRTIMDCSRELKHTLTIEQFATLKNADDAFAADFVSLLKTCQESDDEGACVAAWEAFASEARVYLEPWAASLTKRQRSLLHVIRMRINKYGVASDAEKKGRSWL